MSVMLDVQNINVYYGAIHAVKDISFHVDEGEIVTLIGANGAGKSTTLQTVSGLLRSKTGSITFMGKDIAGIPAHKLVSHGLAQVPEGRAVFLQMTVEENLEMGAYTRPKGETAGGLEMVYEQFPRLKERRRQVAGTLSGGEQQMLAMGRALMSKPQAPHAGRAHHGPGPHPGGADLRDHPGPPQDGHHHPLGGAERPDGPLGGRPGLCPGDRAHRQDPPPAHDLLEDESVKKAYLGG